MIYLGLLALILMSGFTFSGCHQGKTPGTAFIASYEGEAQIKKAGTTNWIKAEIKASLSAGDVIKTGNNSQVLITFFDGSTIELKSGTQIEIRELLAGKTTRIRLKQEIGETLNKVKKLTDSASRYEIETPTAVAGVRGSQMIVKVAADGTTTVQNIEGKISVTAQGKEVLIPEGQTSTIEPGQQPGAPAAVLPASIAPTPKVNINADKKEDVFDLDGKPVSGYPYLDIINQWIERKGDNWVISMEMQAKYPATVDPDGVVEWNIMVDADNDINTGWRSALLFNDLGIDYYLYLSRTGTRFLVGAQRTADSSRGYRHFIGYSTSMNGNTLSIEFSPDTIGNSNRFSFIVLTRQYSKAGDPQSLMAADKIPDLKHFMISIPVQ